MYNSITAVGSWSTDHVILFKITLPLILFYLGPQLLEIESETCPRDIMQIKKYIYVVAFDHWRAVNPQAKVAQIFQFAKLLRHLLSNITQHHQM